MARGAHGVPGRVAVGFDARAHQAQHHIVARADGKVRVHPCGIAHRGVRHDHARKAPFAAQHVGQQRLACAGPRRAEMAVA